MNFKNNKNKATIAIQTIFFIMMSALMIWIVLYGVQKLFTVDSQITEQDRVFIQNQIENILNKCQDPLNSGNLETIRIKNKNFNGLCLLSKKILTPNDPYYDYEEFKKIYNSNHNTILVKTNFISNSIPNKIEVISSFKTELDLNQNEDSICFFDYKNEGFLIINFTCK